MIPTKWKSVVLWSAVAAQIISLLQLLGVFAKIGIDPGYAGNVVAAVLQILVTFGILSKSISTTVNFIKSSKKK
jgi:uncharacterized membrane protein